MGRCFCPCRLIAIEILFYFSWPPCCFGPLDAAKETVEAAPPIVEVAEVTQRDVPITMQWVAALTGLVNAQIRAQVSGYLTKQMYTNGAYVKKGTPLFQLDPRTFQAAVDQAKGVLQQAKGELARAQAQQGKTQQDVTRYTPLAQTGAISKQELDDAVQANLAALAQMESGRAAVVAAEASLETARLNLGFSTIVSPIDGIAGIASAQVGDFISPQSANPLTTISTINPILANLTPSEREYLKAVRAIEKSGETEKQALDRLSWELQLTDGTEYPLKGKFYALDRQVDVNTGAILLQVEFPNPKNLLRPGGFGNVRTVGRIEMGALLVPQRAVADVQGKYLIAVVGSEDKVHIRPVTMGEENRHDVDCHRGLTAWRSGGGRRHTKSPRWTSGEPETLLAGLDNSGKYRRGRCPVGGNHV